MFKKKAKVKPFRNILTSPFQIQWAEKSSEEIDTIENALKELLPAAKLEERVFNVEKKGSVDIKNKSHVPFRSKPNIYRSYLTPGFQSVVRALEKKALCCVLLNSDVTASMLQKVVLAYAQKNNVPVVLLPNLKTVTKSALRFSTMALGFKTIVAESLENKFHPIYKMVSQSASVLEPSIVLQKREVNETDRATGYSVTNRTSQADKRHSKTKILHLYRRTTGERIFIPDNKANNIQSSKPMVDNVREFLSLEETSSKRNVSSLASNKKITSKSNYDDDDDSDSDAPIDFFMDNTPDESLLKSETLKLEGTSTLSERENVSLSTTFKKKSFKTNNPNKTSVRFRPLSVKVVTSNSKKNRRRKKKNKNKPS